MSHIVPTVSHRHEVSVADVHTKIHRTRLAVERFQLVVNLHTVVKEIRPSFGVKHVECTRIASNVYGYQISPNGERLVLTKNERRMTVFRSNIFTTSGMTSDIKLQILRFHHEFR